jgi:hypothetical protein
VAGAPRKLAHHDRAAFRNKLWSICRQCLLLTWWYLPWNLPPLFVGLEDFYTVCWRTLQKLDTIRWRALEKIHTILLAWSLQKF